jgi:hypothetical protein
MPSKHSIFQTELNVVDRRQITGDDQAPGVPNAARFKVLAFPTPAHHKFRWAAAGWETPLNPLPGSRTRDGPGEPLLHNHHAVHGLKNVHTFEKKCSSRSWHNAFFFKWLKHLASLPCLVFSFPTVAFLYEYISQALDC